MDSNRGRLLALRCGTCLYILILVNEIRFIGSAPLLALIAGTILNGAILTTFIVALRRARSGNENQAKVVPLSEAQPNMTQLDKPRNIRLLWPGAGLYFVAMLIAMQYATKIPYQLLAIAGILNMAIILTFVFKLRKAYLYRGKSENS